MATLEHVAKELDKLKKSELIEIIVYKKLSMECKVSESLRKFIERSESAEFFDPNCESITRPLDNDLSINLKWEVKCLSIELDYAKRLNSELVKTINDKELIINLLKDDRMHKDTNTTERSVATSTGSSGKIVNNRNGKKLQEESKGETSYASAAKSVQKHTQIPQQNIVTPQQLDRGIREAQKKITAQYVNLNNETNQWEKVTYKRRKTYTIKGNNSDKHLAHLTGVPKTAILHVYRLPAEATANELQNIMQQNFPEARCEAIDSKYPNEYSSFKVTIYESNFKKAMNPSLWPSGAYVQRFFTRVKTNHSIP